MTSKTSRDYSHQEIQLIHPDPPRIQIAKIKPLSTFAKIILSTVILVSCVGLSLLVIKMLKVSYFGSDSERMIMDLIQYGFTVLMILFVCPKKKWILFLGILNLIFYLLYLILK